MSGSNGTRQPRWVGDSRLTELIDDGTYDALDVRHTPGAQTPLHRHTRYAEQLHVIEGSYEVWAGDEHRVLEAGDSASVPIGVVHTLRAGPSGGHGLVVSRPAGFAGLVRAAGAASKEAFDRDVFAAAAAAAGDELLGPPGARPPVG